MTTIGAQRQKRRTEEFWAVPAGTRWAVRRRTMRPWSRRLQSRGSSTLLCNRHTQTVGLPPELFRARPSRRMVQFTADHIQSRVRRITQIDAGSDAPGAAGGPEGWRSKWKRVRADA